MNLNLLEKMAAVEIKSDNRISEADRHFCEIQQQAYHEAKEELQKSMTNGKACQNAKRSCFHR